MHDTKDWRNAQLVVLQLYERDSKTPLQLTILPLHHGFTLDKKTYAKNSFGSVCFGHFSVLAEWDGKNRVEGVTN